MEITAASRQAAPIRQSKTNIITSMAMNRVMVPTMSARLWASRVSVSAAAASSRPRMRPEALASKKAQRGLHHMGHALLADVGRRAEGRQMGTHQAREVQDDASHRKGERQPAVLGDALRRRPVRRHRDQIPGRQPDANVGPCSAAWTPPTGPAPGRSALCGCPRSPAGRPHRSFSSAS